MLLTVASLLHFNLYNGFQAEDRRYNNAQVTLPYNSNGTLAVKSGT